MSDFPYLPPSSKRGARDRIEAVIQDLTWHERSSIDAEGDHGRRVAAGVLRKAFMPELAHMRNTEETLGRVRKLARQFREDEAIPVRRLLAALYGEEEAMTDDLVAFLRARLEEDERIARAAHAIDPAPWYEDVDYEDTYTNQRVGLDGVGLVRAADNVALWDREQSCTLSMTAATSVHIARHDPARVLAEADAKRRIIDECAEMTARDDWEYTDAPELAELTLLMLALPYREHPDYRPGWALEA